jgi:hypothetical protein
MFGDFPINTTLLMTVHSFIDKVQYDVFQRVICGHHRAVLQLYKSKELR